MIEARLVLLHRSACVAVLFGLIELEKLFTRVRFSISGAFGHIWDFRFVAYSYVRTYLCTTSNSDSLPSSIAQVCHSTRMYSYLGTYTCAGREPLLNVCNRATCVNSSTAIRVYPASSVGTLFPFEPTTTDKKRTRAPPPSPLHCRCCYFFRP